MDGKAPRENLDTGSMDEAEVCTSEVCLFIFYPSSLFSHHLRSAQSHSLIRSSVVMLLRALKLN